MERGGTVRAVLRFAAVLGIATLCGLCVYVGGWASGRLLVYLAGEAGWTASGPIWGFLGFLPGALTGAGIAYLLVRRFRIGIGRGPG